MGQRRHKPDPNQQPLPLGELYRERFVLLEAIAWQRTGLTRCRWKNLRNLLKEIHRVDQGQGCWKSRQSLAEDAEISTSTYDRAMTDAKELNLIEVETRARQTGNGGRSPNLMRVNWKAVASIDVNVASKSTSEVDHHLARVDHHLGWVDHQDGEAIIRNNTKLSTPRRDGSRATEFEIWSDAQQAEVWRLRAELIGRIAPLRDRRDLLDATKAVALSVTRFGEHWLLDAAEAVRARRPKKPWAYFRRCLSESTRDLGEDLGVAMARCNIPDSLLTPRKPVADLSERLCDGGRL